MVKWILDKTIDNNHEEIVKAISSCGFEYSYMDYVPFYRTEDLVFPYDTNDCVIPYTTINLGKYLKRYYGSFLDYDSLKFSNYYAKVKISKDLWLNNDFILTNFYDFKINYSKYQRIFNSEALFVRPDSGMKLFTGFVINNERESISEINALEQLSGVVNENIIFICKPKKILKEFRFIIAGKNIIDGSLYNSNGILLKDNWYPNEAYQLAQYTAMKIFESKEQFLKLCTCDIAQVDDNEYKIIEINSFNSAGWYACNKEKVVQGVSMFIENEYNRDKEEGLF